MNTTVYLRDRETQRDIDSQKDRGGQTGTNNHLEFEKLPKVQFVSGLSGVADCTHQAANTHTQSLVNRKLSLYCLTVDPWTVSIIRCVLVYQSEFSPEVIMETQKYSHKNN